MIVRPYLGKAPLLGERVFVAENAAIIGDVEIGDDCSIWYATTIRGDANFIRIGARTNVQDNCTIHATTATHPTVIGNDVTIGHGAIVHGCTVERGALIGMGSRVLDGAVVGESAMVGAGALVPPGMRVPPRTLVVGLPARVVRPLHDDELARLEESWKHYVETKENYLR
ncbi:MAG TPA: gamma carbonic anhydrase family protein [Thermoanaerobaculia bacterium]|jgi:carbonic anhydrase/acetyltransferase-like protein (isoleucine patch superfamily)